MKICLPRLFALAAGLPALLASGCIQLEPSQVPAPATKISAEEAYLVLRPRADDILVYLQGVLAMPAVQQAKELDQAQKDFLITGTAEDRLRLAGLLLMPGRTSTDRSKAVKLLNEYLADRNSDHGGLEGLATLLKMQLSEISALQKQVAAEKDRGDSLLKLLNEQKIQIDNLSAQLEELKKIEKIIIEREKAGTPEK